jgi:hypothetical protein
MDDGRQSSQARFAPLYLIARRAETGQGTFSERSAFFLGRATRPRGADPFLNRECTRMKANGQLDE